MSKHNKKKDYSFAKNFLCGKKVAEQRVILARRYNSEDISLDKLDIKEYVLLRKEWDGTIYSGPVKSLARVLGYAYGIYLTFCPSQSQLDNFDREISGLTQSAMKEFTRP